MRVVFLRSTEVGLRWFNRYYRPEGGRNARQEMSQALQRLSAHPRIGPETGEGDARRLVITRTPFALEYRVAQDRIEILRVLDDRANSTQHET
jgi:plasmid stabilization system protein ParE